MGTTAVVESSLSRPAYLFFFQEEHGYRLDSNGAKDCLNGATVFAAKWWQTQPCLQVPAAVLPRTSSRCVFWHEVTKVNGHRFTEDGPDKTVDDAVSHIRSLTDSGNSRIPPLEESDSALRVWRSRMQIQTHGKGGDNYRNYSELSFKLAYSFQLCISSWM